MKKLVSALLLVAMCFSLLLSFAACGEDEPKKPESEKTEQSQKTEEGEKDAAVEVEPETDPEQEPEKEPEQEPEKEPEPMKMSFDQFLDQAAGVWVISSSISPMGEEYSYSFCSISKEYFGSAVYPGGGDRPGKIVGFDQIGANKFSLNLLYEAGEFMGEPMEEVRDTLLVTLLGNGKAKIGFESGDELAVIYGGAELEDAHKAVAAYMK